MQLHDLLDGIDVVELRGDPAVEVRAVAYDSRQVDEGALFCCIPGHVSDGHEYALAAARSGAVALLVERVVAVDVTQVRVPSVREAIGPISARLAGYPSQVIEVVGVTGTNGKTTTTYLLEAIAVAAGRHAGLIGTVETRYARTTERFRHTTPEAPELQALLGRMRDAGVDIVAMEVSSHTLDQHRVDGTRFAVACFLNLSQDHLDYHGTLDEYRAAKARLFTPAFTRHAVVNVGDGAGREVAAAARAAGLNVATFAVDGPDTSLTADVRASRLDLGPHGGRFVLYDGATRSEVPIEIALPGRFNVENAVAAAATARVLGLGLDAVVAGLAVPLVVPGRMERIDNDRGLEIIVDYAHTPAALTQALEAARSMAGRDGRVIVVFGCGGDRDREKRPQMGAATQAADLAVLTSDNPRSEDAAAIADDVLAGVPERRIVVQLDRRAAIRDALAVARAGDVVLIAGKGHEQGQSAAGVTVPFDDRAVAREELEALRCA